MITSGSWRLLFYRDDRDCPYKRRSFVIQISAVSIEGMDSSEEAAMSSRLRQQAARFNVADAHLLLEDLPSDHSDFTDEEIDSDPDDPDFQPVVPVANRRVPDRLDFEEDSTSDSEEPTQPAQTTRPVIDHQWRKRTVEKTIREFNKHEGPIQEHFIGCNTPGSYFLKFFDLEIQENIIYQTNLYITQRGRRVAPVSQRDLFAFIGINFLMGYHILPSYTHYWSSERDLGVPFVANAMTRDRFSQLLSNLHVADNQNLAPEDKLAKVRPLIKKANENFALLYDARKVQSVDESMILFKGRSSLKQYCPMKPIKRGYKVWVRADNDGYISKFDVYQGKNGAENQQFPDFGLGEAVVLEMVKELFDKGHEVYFDNFFSSVPLMDYLASRNTSACGTIRSNRTGLPRNMKVDWELTRGEFDYRTADGLSYFAWKDNKVVTVLSNFHGTDATTVNRTKKDGTQEAVNCPVTISDYNKHMGGVDKADMLCSLYGLNRKSKKWWHRIFFGILERMLINTCIVFNQLEDATMPILTFRRHVTQNLLTLSKPPQIGRPLSVSRSPSPNIPAKRRKADYSVAQDVRMANLGAHWVIFSGKRGRCEVCSKKKIESRPHSQCSTCQVFLCCNEKKQCFAEFHEVN